MNAKLCYVSREIRKILLNIVNDSLGDIAISF
jgi:hypothetical protein